MQKRRLKNPVNARKARVDAGLKSAGKHRYKKNGTVSAQDSQAKQNDSAGGLINKIKTACFSTKEKKRRSILVAAIAVTAACLFALNPASGPAAGESPPALTAVKITASFDSASNTFVLTGLEQFSEEEIGQNLTLNPNIEFEIEMLDDGGVRIVPTDARNIAYKGTFAYTAADGGAKTVAFEVNAPALTVEIDSRSIHEYGSVMLTFSEQVDIYSLERNLTITPELAFDISHELNEVWISPHEGWLYSDSYKITVGEGYKSANGKQLSAEKTFDLKISESNYLKRLYPYIEFKTAGDYLINLNDDMTVSFFASKLEQDVPVAVNTYRVPSLEGYRERVNDYLDSGTPLDTLEMINTGEFVISNSPSDNGRDFSSYQYEYDAGNIFTLPNPGEGAYILEAVYADPHTNAETNVRASYLVTPVSAYMQSSERETSVWLNSSVQGRPLAGCEVTFDGMDSPAGKTDANGLLIVPNDRLPVSEDYSSSHIPFSVTGPDGALLYYDSANMYVSQSNREHYYSYLFLDRTIYKPEDTVCFWGYVKPFRENKRAMPQTAFVRFDPEGLDLTVEARIDENGIFSGEIELERIRSTQYAVSAELRLPPSDSDDGLYNLETEYISVKEFQKPTFVLSSKIDKDYYAGDDRVTVTASASFYDGTPLPNYPLEIDYYNTNANKWVDLDGVKTDSMGIATFSFPAVGGGESLTESYYLHDNRYKVQIAGDGEQVTHIGDYSYFPSDILTETSFEEKDGNVSMTVRTYEFDVDSPALAEYMEQAKADNSYWRWYSESELIKVAKGRPVDVSLRLSLRWLYTDRNNISHRNSHKYIDRGYVWYRNSYILEQQYSEIVEDWETELKRIRVNTENGIAIVDDLIYKRDENIIDFSKPVHISAEVLINDRRDNSYTKYSYYTNTGDYDYWSREYDEHQQIVKGYSFAVTDVTTGQDVTPKSMYYSEIPVSAEHNLRLDLLLDGAPVQTDGRIFYSILQDGMLEHGVVEQNSLSMPYKISYGREVRLVAVYFDGDKTRYIKQFDLRATDESLAVSIEVTPDKAGYRPGETVNLDVRATDYMGRGVEGNLCVAVVDESIFALAEQEVDALYGVFNTFYNFNNSVNQYCTTYRNANEPTAPVDGGKGDEGGVEFYDSYRSNFKDTALFLPTRTDSGGNSNISFTLPDNTTSWRITAVEIGGNMRAGQNKSNIISSLPFFVKPVMTSKYIEGDEVSMLVQGHGTLLDEGDEIAYTTTLTGDGVDITLTGSGKTGVPLEFNFGKLPVGSYTVVSRAQYSGYADTVELPLDILKSNLELVISKPVDPQKPLDISAVRYPVTLSFYDRDNEAFFASINSLFGHYCMQANQRLSRFVAKRVVRDTVAGGKVPSYIAAGNDNASDMQNDDGGIAFYPGDSSDPLVTTYVLLVAKDQFNLPLMASYYRNELEEKTDPKIRAACWLGLAAIGDASTDEILSELEKPGLKTDVRAYLVAALAYLGETERALLLYNQELSPIVAGVDPNVRRDESFELDAAAIWVAASRLRHPDADALSIYFGGTHWRYRTLFECMIYVTNYNRQVNPIELSYTVKGETNELNLGLSGIGTLVLSKSELESLELVNPPASLKATAYYVGEPSEFGMEPSGDMSISKSITQADDDTYKVSLTIKLGRDAPTGYYDISDWVPSNTRLYSHDESFGAVYFDAETEGQKLYISFHNSSNAEREIIYNYYVRQTYAGTAVLDTTYMIHGDSGGNCHTEKAEFAPSAPAGRLPAIKAAG